MQQYRCSICGYIYAPKIGDETNVTPPQTAFEDLPEDCGFPALRCR